MNRSWLLRANILVFFMGTLCSCATYQDQVGSAHMSVISVAPWDSRKNELKPDFVVSPTEALQLIAQHTTSLHDSNTSSFSFGLGGGSAASSNNTGPQNTVSPTGNISGLAISTITVMDPMSAFMSATALFQEIKLLNYSVEDVVKRDGYIPYIVRMQVTLMPFKREAPYDVYMTAAFFPSTGTFLPQVVPLLVTDSMETAEHYSENENSNLLELASLGLFGNKNLGENISKSWRKLQARLGQDRNSLLTVARLTDNSIRVRFGAARQVSSEYAMIPQNHYVTILLLVPNCVYPENKRNVELVTESYFVNIENGKVLRSRDPAAVKNSIKAITQRFSQYDRNCDSNDWGDLVQYAINNDYASFAKTLPSTCKFTKAIYTSLLSLQAGNRADSTAFELPATTMAPRKCVLDVPASQSVAVSTEGSSSSVENNPLNNVTAPVIPQGLASSPSKPRPVNTSEKSTQSQEPQTPVVTQNPSGPVIHPVPSPRISIYGTETTEDYFAVSKTLQTISDSVVSLWKSANVSEYDGKCKLATRKFGEALNLCSGELFREQPVGAFCSGVLVSEDMVLTSGNCIKDTADCKNVKLVFGYKVPAHGEDAATTMPKNEVYDCSAIVKRHVSGESASTLAVGDDIGPDYSLLKLDRKVTGHKPLPISRRDSLTKNSEVVIIGHPAGLPLKVTMTRVRDVSKRGYFMAELEPLGGNSGSLVFNRATAKIEGIQMRTPSNGVKTPAGCVTMGQDALRDGRDVAITKIFSLSADIPKLSGE